MRTVTYQHRNKKAKVKLYKKILETPIFSIFCGNKTLQQMIYNKGVQIMPNYKKNNCLRRLIDIAFSKLGLF